MNTIQKIREIMGLPKTNLYAEVKIDDGRVLVTEADAFEPGVDVRVIDDSGSTVELDAGTYTLEDGRKVIVNEDSRMESFEVEEEEIEVEVELETIPEAEEEGYRDGIDDEKEDVREDMDYDKVRDVLADRFPDLDESVRDAIAQVVSDIYTPEVEVELEAEVEPQEDLSELLEEAFASISKRLEALENVPAESGVNVSPTNLSAKHTQKDLSKLSGVDRALHIIQNSHR
jgi:hypothetical protein